jgi:molecular chaperone GrpE (heat shock protein)
MRRLVRSVLDDEFVIDEQPTEVFLSREENREDLLELISRVMLENERLQEVNTQLQRKSGQPEEQEKILRGLLPTLDSFDRVLHLARSYPASEEIDNWLKSVESIYFRLLTLLEGFGLFQLKSVGKKVDLNLHEVVEYRPSQEHPNDVVISERQKGYVFRGKLLRDAKVVVAYNERSNSRQ